MISHLARGHVVRALRDLGVKGPGGQTEFQVNLKLGLTPRCAKLGLTPRCARSDPEMRVWSSLFLFRCDSWWLLNTMLHESVCSRPFLDVIIDGPRVLGHRFFNRFHGGLIVRV